jgi:hypothetical protein
MYAIVIISLSIVMIGKAAWQPNVQIDVNLQPMSLTIVALNGTQLLLNETSISVLPALRGVGAFENALGIIKGLGNYTGPSLNTFLNLVGGMNSDNALRVTASDGYNKTLSYEEVNGEFATYDVKTGQPVQHNQSLTPILAYHFNDANLSSSDGPLRLAIIGPEGLATSGPYWVKQVVKLEIRYRDDVAIKAVSASKTVIGQNEICAINVTAKNQGGYSETFTIKVYANQTVIKTQTVTLSVGNSTTVTFAWDTTGVAKGSYTLSAYANPVQGETNTTNNQLTYGTLVVTILGDVDGNFEVDIYDITFICECYDSKKGTPPYYPNCDIDGNDMIDIFDVTTACITYGQKYP